MEITNVNRRCIMFREKIDDWHLNTFLIFGEKYDFVIDSGLGSLSMKPVIERTEKSEKQIVLVNTHYHWDHIWGNGCFENAVIISHKKCVEMIGIHWDEMLKNKSVFSRGNVKKTLPNLLFEDEIYFPEDGIRLIYTPGHTVDSISVLDEKEGVMNFADNIGDDLDEIMPSIYTDKGIFENTVEKYFRYGFDTCVSGHNEILDRKTVEKTLRKA